MKKFIMTLILTVVLFSAVPGANVDAKTVKVPASYLKKTGTWWSEMYDEDLPSYHKIKFTRTSVTFYKTTSKKGNTKKNKEKQFKKIQTVKITGYKKIKKGKTVTYLIYAKAPKKMLDFYSSFSNGEFRNTFTFAYEDNGKTPWCILFFKKATVLNDDLYDGWTTTDIYYQKGKLQKVGGKYY